MNKSINIKIVAAIICIVFAASVPAFGQEYTAQELLEDCQKALDVLEGRFTSDPMLDVNQTSSCTGYIRGWTDAMQWTKMFSRPLVCVPEKTTVKQIAQMLVITLKGGSSKLLRLQRAAFMGAFLEKNFPCK